VFPKQTSTGGKLDYKYYVVSNLVNAPASSSWVLMGEVDKFATVSSQRFKRIAYTDSTHAALTVSVSGVAHERVTIGAYSVSSTSTKLVQVPCVLNAQGAATVSCTTTCVCQA